MFLLNRRSWRERAQGWTNISAHHCFKTRNSGHIKMRLELLSARNVLFCFVATTGPVTGEPGADGGKVQPSISQSVFMRTELKWKTPEPPCMQLGERAERRHLTSAKNFLHGYKNKKTTKSEQHKILYNVSQKILTATQKG